MKQFERKYVKTLDKYTYVCYYYIRKEVKH